MSQPQILIVDDDASARRLLSFVLTDAGYRTRAVANGYEADRITRGQFFDLALLDKKMLGLDGIETLKRIKRNNKDRVGRIEQAKGGSAFLDEIGEISSISSKSMQKRLMK